MLLSRSHVSVIISALAMGCSSGLLDPAPRLAANEAVAIDATVKFLSTVEGGCWGLATRRGMYEPIDLAPGLRVDGKRIRVVLRDAPGWASTCMIGALVHVDSVTDR